MPLESPDALALQNIPEFDDPVSSTRNHIYLLGPDHFEKAEAAPVRLRVVGFKLELSVLFVGVDTEAISAVGNQLVSLVLLILVNSHVISALGLLESFDAFQLIQVPNLYRFIL